MKTKEESGNGGGEGSPPCITARRGGCVINIDREATKADADGVVFRSCGRKTTPSSLSKVASRHFIDRSATPPCGDARRGAICPPLLLHLDGAMMRQVS